MATLQELSVRLSANADALKAGLGQATRELQNFEASATKAGRGAAAGLGEADAGVGKLRAGFGALAGQDFRQIGDKMSIGLTLPIVAAGAAAVHMSNDFDQAFARMVALAGVTGDQIGELKNQVMSLATETGRGPQELADALYFASSAGFSAADSMKIVDSAAHAAAAGLGTTADVVNAVTSVMGAYGKENISASEALDILTAAAQSAKIEASELTPQLGRLLPTAKLLHVGFADVAGAMAFLSQVSGDASLSATQLDGVLRKLLTPSQQGRDVLAEMGLSVEQLHAAIAENGLAGALDLLRPKFAGNSDALFKLFDDIQAFQGASLLLTDTTGNLAASLENTHNAQGKLQQAWEAGEGPARDMEKSIAQIQVALIQAGEVIAPFAATVLGGFSTAVGAVMSLPAPLRDVVIGFGLLLAVTGPALSIFGRVKDMVDLSSRAFNALRAAMSSATVATEVNSVATATNSAASVSNLYTKSTVGLGAALGVLAGVAVLTAVAIDGLSHAGEVHIDVNKLTKQSTDELVKGFRDLGMPLGAYKDLAESNIGTAQRLRDGLAAQGVDVSKLDPILKKAADGQAQLNKDNEAGTGVVAALTGATQDQTKATEAEAKAMDEAAKAAEGFGTFISDLASAMDKSYQSMLAPTKLHADYEASIDDLSASIAKNTFTLDDNTEKGRANIGATLQAGEAIAQLIERRFLETHSVDEAVKAGGEYVQRLHDELIASGLTEGQVKQMIAVMHLTPDEIATTFSTNAIETQIVVAKYISQLATIPPEIQSNIEALIAQGELDKANALLADLAKGRTVDLTVEVHGGGQITSTNRATGVTTVETDLSVRNVVGGRARGGPVGPGEVFQGAEEGFEILAKPGFYKAGAAGGYVFTHQQSREMLAAAAAEPDAPDVTVDISGRRRRPTLNIDTHLFRS